jgi:uncharacterized membrane protein
MCGFNLYGMEAHVACVLFYVSTHLNILLLLSRLYCMYLCPLQSLNYAPIAVGVVLLVSGGWWVCGARKWFNGPRRNIDEAEDPTPDLKGGLVSASSKDADQLPFGEVQLNCKAAM